MGITATCQSCNRKYAAPDSMAGKTVKCRTCGDMILLPMPDVEGELGFEPDDEFSSPPRSLDDTPPAMEVPAATMKDPSAGSTAQGIKVPNATRRTARTQDRARDTGMALPESESATVVTYTPPASPWTEWYRHPYALKIDYWLPRAVVVLGVIWLAISMIMASDNLPVWMLMSRLGVLELCYLALVFPLSLVGVRIGSGIYGEAMPRDAAWRGFASYIPALTISVVLWNAGGGTTPALVMGAFLGLAISAAVVMVLFRLEPEKILVVAACGSGGFVLGGLGACLLVYGLNFLTIYGLSQSKNVRVPPPASPFWPGLAWDVKAENMAPTVARPGGASSARPTATKPVSPIVEPVALDPGILGLTNSKLVDRIDATGPKGNFERVLRPATPSDFAVVIRKGESNTTAVDRYDAKTWTLMGSTTIGEPPAVDGIEQAFALSPDGKRLARVAKFPRDSIQVWSYEEKRVEPLIPIEKDDGPAVIVGFAADRRLVVLLNGATPKLRWIDLGDRSRSSDVVLAAPPFAKGFAVALDPTSLRVAVACAVDGKSVILIYEPNPVTIAGATDGPRRLDVTSMGDAGIAPVGLAFSNDGRQIAAYYENGGAAYLATFDTDKANGVATAQNECIFEHAPVPARRDRVFRGSALTWFPARNSWLLYGDAVIENVPGGRVVGNLAIPGVTAQRLVADDCVELVTDVSEKRQVIRVRMH